MGHTIFCDGCGKEVMRTEGKQVAFRLPPHSASFEHMDGEGYFKCKMLLKKPDGTTTEYSYCDVSCLINSVKISGKIVNH